MKEWKLGYNGFIMQYMVAGPSINNYSSNIREENQLKLEASLRKAIVSPKPLTKHIQVKLGEYADNGCPWSVYAPYGNCFIDLSSFYSTLQKIDLRAATVIIVPEDLEVQARIWTYMSVGIYCNGHLVGEHKKPVYKPIQYLDITLSLKKGKNQLLLICDNLGVRDTRNILGVQILNHQEEISIELPDEACQNEVYEASESLANLRLESGNLILPQISHGKVSYCALPESPDYEIMTKPHKWNSLDEMKIVEIPEGVTNIAVRIRGTGYELSRRLEFTERIIPDYIPKKASYKEHFREIMERVAKVSSLNRGGEFGFAISNILARKYLGEEGVRDKELFLETLRLIDKRVDCSDFLMCGLLRYMHHYKIDKDIEMEIKSVLLNYRYWMDMEGTDAMCFWSENHSLMFYISAMNAGQLYPKEFFPRANMTGEQLFKFGRDKVLEWIEDVELYGFEEFLSGVYVCITFVALLNVIDFSDDEISKRARKLTDMLIRQLCIQTFKGCVIAPMGRVYRQIYPFSQGSQSIINLIDPSAPYSYGEGWIAFLATSTYEFPSGLLEEMYGDLSCTYSSGNAEIVLEKNDAYCLTSVQSPRESEFSRWINIRNEELDSDTHVFTKSLNECFHGTTCFQPGVYGYQQHMWYGALSGEAVIFVNHPGSSVEHSGMRPGYWHGNGIMPAIKQVKGILGAIYDTPDYYPIGFTHVYCPMNRFDEVKRESHWLFMQKDKGYIALWCSGEMEEYNDTIFDCELRVYKRSAAYLCICDTKERHESLLDFAKYAQSINPIYDEETKTLETNLPFKLQYLASCDETQFVD